MLLVPSCASSRAGDRCNPCCAPPGVPAYCKCCISREQCIFDLSCSSAHGCHSVVQAVPGQEVDFLSALPVMQLGALMLVDLNWMCL